MKVVVIQERVLLDKKKKLDKTRYLVMDFSIKSILLKFEACILVVLLTQFSTTPLVSDNIVVVK